MLNLLRMEFYKIRRQRELRFILLLYVLFYLFRFVYMPVFIIGEEEWWMESGNISFTGMQTDTALYSFVGIIFMVFTICPDFSQRTMNGQIAAGYSRLKILLAKTITSMLVSYILAWSLPFALVIAVTIWHGWGRPFTAAEALYVVRVAGLNVLVSSAALSITILFSVHWREAGKALVSSLAYMSLFLLLLPQLSGKPPFFAAIARCSPFMLAKSVWSRLLLPAELITILCSSLATVALVLAVTYGLFRKREMK